MSRILPLLVLLAGSSLAAVNLKAGQTIYTSNCQGCHGAKAQGNVGPNLHEAAGWSAAIFARAMLKDVDDKGVMLKSPMPNWGKVGFAGDKGKAPTKVEITNLQAYLKTLK
jgi:mono/diheme cytochrome c family protein